jgi:uncharacterized protein YndB with AHSA1/START domain
MEWTGARYADNPTVEVTTWVDAPPSRVWALVSDVTEMPAFSTELQAVEWLDEAREPVVGARFRGHNHHEMLGDWVTTSQIVECAQPAVFAWAVQGPDDDPMATWRFRLAAKDGGTELTQWVRMGPGRSGLSYAIERMPEKEQKIVFVRMREFETNMTATLAAIKARAES